MHDCDTGDKAQYTICIGPSTSLHQSLKLVQWWVLTQCSKTFKTHGSYTFNCSAHSCHARPLWWPSTYTARPSTIANMQEERESTCPTEEGAVNGSRSWASGGWRTHHRCICSLRDTAGGRPKERGERPTLFEYKLCSDHHGPSLRLNKMTKKNKKKKQSTDQLINYPQE